MTRNIAGLGIICVVLSITPACYPDLKIQNTWVEWTPEKKTVGVSVKNDGWWRASNCRVRFEVEASGKPLAIEVPGGDLEYGTTTPGTTIWPGKTGGAQVDFQPLANEANNCLRDVRSVKVSALQVPNERKLENNVAVVDVHAPQESWQPPGTASLAITTPFGTALESRPISLHFSIGASGTDPRWPIALRELRYQLKHDGDQKSFFNDTVVLFGARAPTEFDVTPGVQYPQDSGKIIVEAQLAYGFNTPTDRDDLPATATITPVPARSTKAERMYERYLDGLLRRHLVSSGRELGISWLKQYEPGKDPKELLWHSRTARAGTDGGDTRTRVYVLWSTSECEPPTHDSTAKGCGRTVANGAVVALGGDENPLLKSGLIMTVFGNEYLASRDATRLDPALAVLKFVEDSEWKDPTDNYAPTGFFLRSDWTGQVFDPSDLREWKHASVDELAGLCLGLGVLNKALLVAGPQYVGLRERLVALVDRMGRQLQQNFYVIAPLRKKDGSWHKMGLPPVLHKGAFGAVAYQWLFAAGFGAITGLNYVVESSSGATDMLATLAGVDGQPEMDWFITRLRDWFGPNSLDLTIGAIQGIGIALYHHSEGTDWTVPIPCFFDKWPILDKPVKKVSFSDFDRFNFPMLLHVYQFGMMNAMAQGIIGEEIRKEMARLIYGVLAAGGTETNLSLKGIRGLEMLLLGPISLGTQFLCNQSPTVRIGTVNSENEAYAAAVALSTDLPAMLDDEAQRAHFGQLIHSALVGAIAEFSENLPLGDSNGGVCFDEGSKVVRSTNGPAGTTALWCGGEECREGESGDCASNYCKSLGAAQCMSIDQIDPPVGVIRHNPKNQIGAEFIWENQLDNRIMGSPPGLPQNRGVSGARMLRLYETTPPIDSAREGIGLDFLVPMSMVIREGSRIPKLPVALPELEGLRKLHAHIDGRTPRLPLCASNPVVAAAPQGSRIFTPCTLRSPQIEPDAAEGASRNDSYTNATPLVKWGTPLRFNLDKVSTLRSSSSTTMDPLYPSVTTVRDRNGVEHSIRADQDYDFFRFRHRRDMLLRVTNLSHQPLMVIADDSPVTLPETISLSGATEHRIMITGHSGEYTINITPAGRYVSGTIQIKPGLLNVALTRDPKTEKYAGRVQYTTDRPIVMMDQVERISGDVTSLILEGSGALRGVAGHQFSITITETCPSVVSIEAKRPDGTREQVIANAAISSGELTFTDKEPEKPCCITGKEPCCPCPPGYIRDDQGRCVEESPPCQEQCGSSSAIVSLKVYVPTHQAPVTHTFKWIGRLKDPGPMGSGKNEFEKVATYSISTQPDCGSQGNIGCQIVGERFDSLMPGEWEIGVWDKEGYTMWANTFVNLKYSKAVDVRCDKKSHACISEEHAQ